MPELHEAAAKIPGIAAIPFAQRDKLHKKAGLQKNQDCQFQRMQTSRGEKAKGKRCQDKTENKVAPCSSTGKLASQASGVVRDSQAKKRNCHAPSPGWSKDQGCQAGNGQCVQMGCHGTKLADKGAKQGENAKGSYAAVLEHGSKSLTLFVGAHGVRKVGKPVPMQGAGDDKLCENPGEGRKQEGKYVRTSGSPGKKKVCCKACKCAKGTNDKTTGKDPGSALAKGGIRDKPCRNKAGKETQGVEKAFY